MKWCILINSAPFLSEFFGKLSDEIIRRGDDCLIIWSSKIAEYEKKKFFSNKARFISIVDWSIDSHKNGKKEFFGLSWKDFFPFFDRNGVLKFDYNKSIEITLRAVQFFEFIFEKEKPDVVIGEPLTSLFHQVAHHFSKKSNVPYFGLGKRLDDKIDVYDSGFTCLDYEKTFRKINNSAVSDKEKEFAKKYIEDFISHKQLVSYGEVLKIHFSQLGLIKHYIGRIKNPGLLLFRYLRKRKYFKDFDYESESILKKVILAPLKMERRQFRILSQKNIFSKIDKQDKDFFLFPLQFQPEASTDVCAIYYCDQLNTIKNIAFSLPFPYKLYVKEHPVAVGTRPKEFYDKLKKIPNVVLISPDEDVENMIRNSSGVITLTSTVGLEAVLVGKPVYIFEGVDVFYSYHPLCRILQGFEELKNKIQKDLINKPDISNLEDINNRFVVSYFRNTIDGDIASASQEKDTNNYQLIFQDLKKIAEKNF